MHTYTEQITLTNLQLTFQQIYYNFNIYIAMPVHCCVEKFNELRNTLRQHFCTKATRRLFLDSYTNGRALSYNTRYRKVRNISLKKILMRKRSLKYGGGSAETVERIWRALGAGTFSRKFAGVISNQIYQFLLSWGAKFFSDFMAWKDDIIRREPPRAKLRVTRE